MIETLQALRAEAVSELERFGIRGSTLYLIDLIPLIEIIWADGKAQEGEIDILNEYLKTHVRRVNDLAGYPMISFDEARTFVSKFLNTRPDPELIKSLRNLFAKLHASSLNEDVAKTFRDSLLAAMIDIASSSVIKYPYGPNERFNEAEKKCFFEIMDSLEQD